MVRETGSWRVKRSWGVNCKGRIFELAMVLRQEFDELGRSLQLRMVLCLHGGCGFTQDRAGYEGSWRQEYLFNKDYMS